MDDAPRLSRAELARLDRLASETFGLPVAVLMENAGRGAAEEILALTAAESVRPRAAVLAGGGNNGGDACVVARHLANAGFEVELYATHALDALSGDAATMRRVVDRMRLPVRGADGLRDLDHAGVIVDGLLGTGFRGDVRPELVRWIEAANAARECGARVVALDLPSGLDADTGRPTRPTIVADVTVTFAAWKVGFDAPEARPYLGRVVLATIGAPRELLDLARRRGQ